jgi:flagellar M-ring protein FliF
MAISTASALSVPTEQNAMAAGVGGGNVVMGNALRVVNPAGASTAVSVTSTLQDVFLQPTVRKAMPGIIVLLALVLLGSIYGWVQETPYRPIFPGMVESDQQTAFENLKAANFNPRLDPTTGNLSVPLTRFHEARILLASQGLPRNQSRGVLDTLKDQTAMTTSQFMEQARYTAAIEQELAKSIAQIGTIQGVRVHLAQTKQSAFLRDRVPTKASVVVTPFGGRTIGAGQVQAIVHLVASSVPYLAPEDVSVVDNLGNLLTKTAGDAAMGLTSVQLQIKQQTEDNYRSRIVQLLEPILGEGNVRAQVDLTMNFSQVEVTTEDFDTGRQGPKTRSENLSEERASKQDAAGIPGALSNSPPAQSEEKKENTPTNEKNGTSSNATLNTKTTRNYEIDKVVRHVKSPMGGVERVTVAVVIKEREAAAKPKDAAAPAAPEAAPAPAGFTPEELERFNAVVKGVVGFKEDRGDVVNIMPAKFEPVLKSNIEVAWYENDMAANIVKVALAALILIVVLLAVVRPVVKSYLTPAGAGAGGLLLAGPDGVAGMLPDEGTGKRGEDGLVMNEGESMEGFRDRLKKSAAPKKSSISADMLDTANTYDDKVALIRLLVAEDSGRVANVLKSMIRVN